MTKGKLLGMAMRGYLDIQVPREVPASLDSLVLRAKRESPGIQSRVKLDMMDTLDLQGSLEEMELREGLEIGAHQDHQVSRDSLETKDLLAIGNLNPTSKYYLFLG